MIRKGFFGIIIASVIFVMAACASANVSGANENLSSQTIRVSVGASADSSLVKAVIIFKDLVEEQSDGRLKVEVFPNSQLGTSREQTEQVQLGTVEMVTADMTTLSSFVDSTSLFAFPYLLPTESEQLFNLLNEDLFDTVSDQFAHKGFKFLGFQSLGYMAITSNDGAIHSPKDMKGLKMRVIPSEVLSAQYKGWGAEPIPVDLVELYTSLQTGIVSAQENPLEMIQTMKYYEVQKFMTLTNHTNRILGLIANKEWFDGLNQDLQDIVTQASAEATEYQRETAAKEYDTYLTELKGKIEVNELTEEEVKRFREISEPLYNQLIESKNQRELFDKIQSSIK